MAAQAIEMRDQRVELRDQLGLLGIGHRGDRDADRLGPGRVPVVDRSQPPGDLDDPAATSRVRGRSTGGEPVGGAPVCQE